MEDRTVPAIIPVLTLADAGPLSLRAAIQQANLTPGQDDIVFGINLQGTVTLQTALPALTDNVTISAPGADVITIARDSAAQAFRIFEVGLGVQATISGLEITNGRAAAARAGGIDNLGTLRLSNVDLNHNTGVTGGGIHNAGNLTLTTVAISENTATDGAGLYNGLSATATVIGTAFFSNHATASGGGIANSRGMVDLRENSQVYDNDATDDGGGVWNSGQFMMTGGTLNRNRASQDGGGIYSEAGTAGLDGVAVTSNTATRDGGGFYLNAGTMGLRALTLTGNTAARGAGGAHRAGSSLTIANPVNIADPIVQI